MGRNLELELCCDWLLERARRRSLARSRLPAASRRKRMWIFLYNKSFICQAYSVEMAGLFPFTRVYGHRLRFDPSTSKKENRNKKTRTLPISHHLILTKETCMLNNQYTVPCDLSSRYCCQPTFPTTRVTPI